MIVNATIWLLVVACALRPPIRRGPLGFAVFVVTMSFNEIPAVLLAVFIASTLVNGRPESPAEWVVGIALVSATVAGMVWLQVRARTARGALERGLDRSLGTQWRAMPLDAKWLRGVLLPFQRRVRGVERTRDLAYGPDTAHRVDIYRGPGIRTTRPVLIHLHGGGFVSGGKSRESVALLNQLASHGWLCLSGNYRLGLDGQHPHALTDAKRLIAWIRENAGELGADPSSVYVAGCSAGAHLAVSAALTPDHAELQPGFEGADTSVAGVIAFYGYLGSRTAAPTSSPALLARSDAPPMLVIHGTNDTAVPIDDVRPVVERLRRTSRNPVVFVELPDAQHSFDLFASVRSRSTATATEAFLTWAMHRAG